MALTANMDLAIPKSPFILFDFTNDTFDFSMLFRIIFGAEISYIFFNRVIHSVLSHRKAIPFIILLLYLVDMRLVKLFTPF